MSVWKEKVQEKYDKEQAAQRLDWFLTITYIYPFILDPEDVEIMRMREEELNIITKVTTYGFFALYGIGLASRMWKRGNYLYFRDWMKHSVLWIGGGLGTGLLWEKFAAEMHYNKILYALADKYNFTPNEVTDLQRNLNEYYIERERMNDITRAQ